MHPLAADSRPRRRASARCPAASPVRIFAEPGAPGREQGRLPAAETLARQRAVVVLSRVEEHLDQTFDGTRGRAADRLSGDQAGEPRTSGRPRGRGARLRWRSCVTPSSTSTAAVASSVSVGSNTRIARPAPCPGRDGRTRGPARDAPRPSESRASPGASRSRSGARLYSLHPMKRLSALFASSARVERPCGPGVVPRRYRCESSSFASWSRPILPTRCSATLPPLNTSSVGIAVMPYW